MQLFPNIIANNEVYYLKFLYFLERKKKTVKKQIHQLRETIYISIYELLYVITLIFKIKRKK